MSVLDAVFAIYGDGLRALADFIDPPASNPFHGHEPERQCSDFPCSPGCESWGCEAEETRSAVGLQHSHTPGEVSADPSPASAPSPGDLAGMADSDLLKLAAEEVDGHAIRSISSITVADLNYLLNLADELRDRAAQFAALESLDTK